MRKILFLTILSVCCLANAQNVDQLRARAEALHASMISLDSHTDAPLRWDEGLHFADDAKNCVNLPKMRRGGVDVQYVAAYVGSEYRHKGKEKMRPLNAKTFAERRARTEHLINLVEKEVAMNAEHVGIARNSADVRTLKAAGKKALMLGVENGLGIGYDLDYIDTLAAKGVTYITLCHVFDNQLCATSSNPRKKGAGLTDFGRKAVERMNRCGVLIDLSHAGEQTFYDVISLTDKPIVASHSGCRALCNHDRNLTDDQLRALAKNGGVIQIVAYAGFLAKPKSKANLSVFVDHIDHAVKVAGIDHVGIGTDFDGGGHIEGLMHSGDFINITMELMRRGYADEDIAKIMGGNWLRVLDQNQANS